MFEVFPNRVLALSFHRLHPLGRLLFVIRVYLRFLSTGFLLLRFLVVLFLHRGRYLDGHSLVRRDFLGPFRARNERISPIKGLLVHFLGRQPEQLVLVFKFTEDDGLLENISLLHIFVLRLVLMVFHSYLAFLHVFV